MSKIISTKEQTENKGTIKICQSLRKVCAALALMLLCGLSGWGQDFSGYYYIVNHDNYYAARWYLVPAKDPRPRTHYADSYFNAQYRSEDIEPDNPDYTGTNYGDLQKPFLTTHHNDLDTELLIWQIVASSETGYYHIIHNKTGKYVKYEYPYRQAKDRQSMHLETTDNPDDDAFKFVITGSMDGNINIRPKSVGSGNRFWNVSGENQDEYHATTGDYLDTGMVGLSNDPTDDKAIWHFVVLPPVVTYDYTTQEVAITDIDPDATIYYTLDGTYPTTSSTLYEAPFEQTESCTVKAIAVRHGISSETTTFELEQVATPSIAVNNNAIAITCATTGASIYYNVGDTPETTTDPTPSSSHYTSPLTSNVSNKCIKAIAVKDGMIISDVQQATLQLKCNKPSISCNGTNFTITHGDFPSGVTVTVYYTYGDNPEDPTTSSEHFTTTSATVSIPHTPYTVKAIAVATDYLDSDIRTVTIGGNLGGSGTESDPYLIASDAAFIRFTLMADTEEGSSKWYKLTANVSASGSSTITHSFSGVLEGKADANGVFHTISDLEEPIFSVIDGGFVTEGVDFVTNQSMVRNIILKDVNISGHSGNTGAIACRMIGNACIYNCGILSGSVGGTGDTGGILGSLERYEYNTNSPKYSFARVVNCFSFANITSAGEFAAGIVGNNAYGPKTDNFHQTNSAFRTAVVNCMFYGDILGGTKKAPVYGNKTIANNSATAINNYNYFLAEAATFNEGFNADAYKNSWPAKEEDLTRFEYYRSILNSNRPLITWYVTNKKGDEQAQSDRDLIAKWVLDPEIAPYPILKKWDKYFSVINPDPDNVWDEESREWKSRDAAADYQGKKLGTLSVTIMTGDHPGEAGMTGISVINDKSWTLNITDMDTLNHDYCYYKVQLPYYNEVFGDKTKTDFIERYYGNYTDKVVTGWKIVSVNDGDEGESYTFNSNWESGCNFADRTDKYKDLYAKSGRVFAQGGYYYVPEDVTAITIEAYWGKAVYLHNKEHYVDRVYEAGSTFAPAGILPDKFPDPTNGYSVYDDIKTAISSLDLEGSGATAKTVYDQAIVLVGNYQFKNKADQSNLGWNNGSGSTSFSTNLHPFTMTSVDLDFDNEPDCCLELQYGEKSTRVNIHPVRFDFLPIPSLGMAMRTSSVPQSCGIFILRGHFEITETAYMHFGQFEYDTRNDYRKELAPVIINGGRIDQIVSSERFNLNTRLEKTSYFILGGHLKMKTFSPGCHGDGREGYDHHVPFKTRHCAVNVIGGQFGDFYLSGMFNKNVEPVPDNPHCYSNGGKFNLVAGAGQEKINCDKVTFRMDHSIIGEFYGGGINGEFSPAQITGNIDVVVDNSIVGKFCGGPKTGDMADGTNVTTEANGTTFGMFYGAGNGGTNYRRVEINDNNGDTGAPTPSVWNSTFEFGDFAPFINKAPDGQYAKYTSQYEFELMNVSSGSNNNVTARSYRWEAEFTATKVMQATSTLNNCTVLQDFYGGGNLGPVMGDVTSTLFNTKIYGSAYGGGYSGAIPTIRVHDVSTVKYPYRDGAGVCHDGSLDFVKDGNTIREYQWTNENILISKMAGNGIVTPMHL